MHVIYCLLALLGGVSVTAQAPSDPSPRLELLLPYDTVGIDEVFEITLTLHNTQPLGSNVALPAVEGLEWLPGSSSSQQISIVNGAQTSLVRYHYRARATQLGLAFIPAVEVETQEGYFRTAEQVVVVVADLPLRSQSPLREEFGASPFNDPFFQSPFGGFPDMNQRLEQMRRDMQERQQRFREDLERRLDEEQQQQSPKKQRKTYRI